MKKLAAAFLFVSLGCVSSQQVTTGPTQASAAPDAPDAPDPEQWKEPEPAPEVWAMRLTQEWGEVGQPFAAKLEIHDNIQTRREVHIDHLPPGLRYDADKARIVGVPKQSGFYMVNVAVRPQLDESPLRYAQATDRWHTEEFELRIYNAISD